MSKHLYLLHIFPSFKKLSKMIYVELGKKALQLTLYDGHWTLF